MRLIRHLSQALTRPTAIAIGSFDGFHCGHQSIITQLKQLGQRHQVDTMLVFFEPQPKEFFDATFAPARLMSRFQKLCYLHQAGIDIVACIRFTRAVANISAASFFHDQLLSRWGMQHLLVGQDFRFGKNRAGNVAQLTQWCQQSAKTLHIAAAVHAKQQRISSTWVRQLLAEGELTLAQTLLARPFIISGRVGYGQQLARQIGVPTANIRLHPKHNLPLRGVFLVRARVNTHGLQVFDGIANIGVRPTVDGDHPQLEVHLFAYSGSLYGRPLEVEFVQKLRDEQRFSSLEALAEQIHRDVSCAKDLLSQGVRV